MAVFKVVPQSFDSSELDDWGPVLLPLSEPACTLRGRYHVVAGCEDTKAGVWECTVGRYRRQNLAGEMMHILSGTCTYTDDNGQKVEGQAGDTFYFEPNSEGVWDIHSTMRKTFVLY